MRPTVLGDQKGVGKGHKNRHPRRGPQISWLHRIEEIMERIEESRQQYFDRHDLETLFDLRTTAAWSLMQQVGPTQTLGDVLGAGTRLQVRVICRRDLILFISRVRQSVEFFTERLRHENMVDKLAAAAKIIKARKVIIRPIPTVDNSIAGLPPGIKLSPGRLEITFFGIEDLTAHLYALLLAMQNDFIRFQSLIEQE